MPIAPLLTRSLVVATLLGALAACNEQAVVAPPPAPKPARAEFVTPFPETTYVGRAAGYPAVRVLDAAGLAMPGIAVRFHSRRAGSSVAQAVDTTDAEGLASAVQWMAATVPGVDTLVVSVDSGPGLRALVPVRAGPIARIDLLAPGSGTGSVLASMLGGDAFRIVDPYENPVPFVDVELGIVATASTAAPSSRLASRATSDASGIVRVPEWVPRTLGDYAMRAYDPGNDMVRSELVQRAVATPACAPTAMLRTDYLVLTGTLHGDAATACADSIDRWAFAVTEPVEMGVRRTPGTTSPVRFRVIRAGSPGPSGVIVPATRSARALLPAGEYEVIVEPEGATGSPVAYSMQGGFGALLACDTIHVMPRANSQVFSACARTSADAGVTDAPSAVLAVHVAGAAGRDVNVTVVAQGALRDGGEVPWTPIVVVYGRRPDGTTELLGTYRPTGVQLRVAQRVADAYSDLLILVTATGMNDRQLRFNVDAL